MLLAMAQRHTMLARRLALALRERATRTPCVMLKGLVQLLVLVVLVLWERGGGGSRLRR